MIYIYIYTCVFFYAGLSKNRCKHIHWRREEFFMLRVFCLQFFFAYGLLVTALLGRACRSECVEGAWSGARR